MHRFSILAALAGGLFAQLPTPNQSGVSLGHVHLMVEDPDAQKKIWMEALGAEATHTGTLELLRLPGIYIIVGKARTAPTEGSDGSTVNHIGLAVKDLTAVKTKLDALHIASAPVNGNAKQIMAKFPEKVTAFRKDMAVHGKFKEACPRCGKPIARIRYADNETNYCPHCQTGGKVLADRALSRLLK